MIAFLLLTFLAGQSDVAPPAPSAPTGEEVMQKLNARPEPARLSRRFTFELTDRRGGKKHEEIEGHRASFDEERRTVLFYTDPGTVRGIGFLTFDYDDPGTDDDQWLYLPALGKIRRVSAADRGDPFLGTDFTYEEIKKDQKVEFSDYRFTLMSVEDGAQGPVYTVEGIPTSDDVARELGVSRVVWHIDPAIWMSRRTEHYDRNGNHARTIALETFEVIDGFVTATEVNAVNHKTGHSSRLVIRQADNDSDVPDRMFTQAQLRRGL